MSAHFLMSSMTAGVPADMPAPVTSLPLPDPDTPDVRDVQAALERDGDFVRAASLCLDLLIEIGQVAGYELRRLARRMPCVAVLGGAAQRAARVSAYPYRYARLLNGLRLEVDAVVAIVVAAVCGFFFAPQVAEDFQPLVGHGAALGVRHIERLELFFQPAYAHATNCSALGEHIQRCEYLRLEDGVAVRHDDHCAADADTSGACGDVCEHGQSFEERRIVRASERAVRSVGVLVRGSGGQHDVIANPDRLEAKFLRFLRELAKLVAVHRIGQTESVFHSSVPFV